MNPFPTMEIRWFGRGTVPTPVERWFDILAAPSAPQSPRTDHYLIGTGPGLGIKLREGRIELKQREGRRQRVEWRGIVEGAMEKWRKWSFILENVDAALAAAAETPDAWIGVRKSRTVKTYGYDKTGTSWPGLAGAPAICGVELAEVTVDGDPWWTIGLESSGRSDLRRSALLAVSGRVFGLAEDFRLPAAASYGYARWLGEPAGSPHEEE